MTVVQSATVDALSPGDFVCLVSDSFGVEKVQKALPAVLAIYGRVYGIATQAASAGGAAVIQTAGSVPTSIHGLTGGPSMVRVSLTARPEKVSSYVVGDFPGGNLDAQNRLFLHTSQSVSVVPGVATLSAGPGVSVSSGGLGAFTASLAAQSLTVVDPLGLLSESASLSLTTDPRPVAGATGVYTDTTLTYDSSIDSSITGIQANYTYDNGLAALGLLPVLVVMHGYGSSPADFSASDRQRWASYGFLVLVPAKRARDGSGREIHDILDAVAKLRATVPAVAHATLASVVGYSGGGGNALACAHKVPDFFTTFTSFFGLSDYGYDSNDGWWYTREGIRSLLTTDVGNRVSSSAPYRARDAVGSIAKTLAHGGYLYMFHDDADTDVTVANSRRVRDAMARAGLSNFAYAESTSASSPRWSHGTPGSNADLIQGEWRFVRRAKGAAAWSMPERGSIRVAGWHKNKRFEIWLGGTNPPKTTLADGKQHAADVVYDTLAGTYFVTPLTTGTLWVQIIQGNRQRIVQVTAPTEISMSSAVTDAWAAAANLPGCVLSLEADTGVTLSGSDVTAWNDQSALGDKDYTGGSAKPTFEAAFEGAAALRWQSASSQYMSGPVIIDPNKPYFMAFAIRPESGTVYAWSQANSSLFTASMTSYYNANTAAAHQAINSTGTAVESVATSSASAWHFVAIWRDADGKQYIQVDDSQVDFDPGPSGSISGTDRSSLGCRCDSPGFWTFGNMRLRAVCGANRAPYDDERAKLRNFWKAKYGGLP